MDQSLISDIAADAEQVTFVGAILRLIESVGLRTVVEGIETIAQMEQLLAVRLSLWARLLFQRTVPAEQMRCCSFSRPSPTSGRRGPATGDQSPPSDVDRRDVRGRVQSDADPTGGLARTAHAQGHRGRLGPLLGRASATGVGGDVLWDSGDLDEMPILPADDGRNTWT